MPHENKSARAPARLPASLERANVHPWEGFAHPSLEAVTFVPQAQMMETQFIS